VGPLATEGSQDRMDQVTASIQMTVEGNFRLLTTEYISECGCQWVVDMWGNVRRVRICPRDSQGDIRDWDQLPLFTLEAPRRSIAEEIMEREF